MASYPDGTVFDSPEDFPKWTTFGKACVFADGCSFENPCFFGDACVIGRNSNLYVTRRSRGAHVLGTACVVGKGSSLDEVEVGDACIIQTPSYYAPVSEGKDVLVGEGHNKSLGGCLPKITTHDYRLGLAISGCKVAKNWEEASNPAGFDADGATIYDTSWGVNKKPL